MENQEQNKISSNTLLAAVVLEPTCVLRLNMCKRQMKGGELQQMWIDKISGNKYWKPIPIVHEP